MNVKNLGGKDASFLNWNKDNLACILVSKLKQ
jgi:hypothetical protein